MSEQGFGIVAPQGRIDAATAPQLETDLRNHMVAGRSCLVVDFSNVYYLSSSALKVLLVALREARSQGGDIRLASLCERVYDILEMAGFHKLFGIDGSVEEAMGELRATPG